MKPTSRPILAFALVLLALALAGCGRNDRVGAGLVPARLASAPSGLGTPAPATVAAGPTTTPVPSASPTATASPTPSPTPEPTATPTPTPTPAPRAIQLTSGGCCTQPFWSPDSTQVWFIDKPSAGVPVGIWGVPVAQPLSEPVLVSQRLELSTGPGDYIVETSGRTTTLERVADGARWTVPAGGHGVLISPGRTRIAWTVGNADLPPDRQVTAIWIANLDGSGARQVASLRRGGLSGWTSEDALLVSGRESASARDQVLWALSIADGARIELARAERLRSTLLSPGGDWVAYYITFDAEAARNGLWLVRTDGTGQLQAPRELFGAYQWRGCPGGCPPGKERLLVVPFRPDATLHELWELDPATGEARQITDPAITPFKIANGDWQVSPDGRYVAFVESTDRNIWVIELPS